MCINVNKILCDIQQATNIDTNVNSFKLIVGLHQYSTSAKKPKQARPMRLSSALSNNTKYGLVNGEVAFITSNNVFPCSLIMIMGLLFGGIHTGDQILRKMRDKKIPMECLVKYLYNKGIVLINNDKIQTNNANMILSGVSHVLLTWKNRAPKCMLIAQLGNKVQTGRIIHPSAMNFDQVGYHETWFEHNDSYIALIKNKTCSFKDFKVR